MTNTDRQRLAAILGMLGSDHAGERAAAGLQAEAFRKKHGLTWTELLALQPEDETPVPSGDPDDPYPDMCDGEAWKPQAQRPAPHQPEPEPEPAPQPTPRSFNIFPRAFMMYAAMILCCAVIALSR